MSEKRRDNKNRVFNEVERVNVKTEDICISM